MRRGERTLGVFHDTHRYVHVFEVLQRLDFGADAIRAHPDSQACRVGGCDEGDGAGPRLCRVVYALGPLAPCVILLLEEEHVKTVGADVRLAFRRCIDEAATAALAREVTAGAAVRVLQQIRSAQWRVS